MSLRQHIRQTVRQARNAIRATRLAFLLVAIGNAAVAAEYGYPFEDPLVATVVGTPVDLRAELPQKVPLQELSLTPFPDREIPELFWYSDSLKVGFLQQEGPAPLIFLIAGTGASHKAGKIRILLQIAQKMGFHAISLPSPTFQNFIVSGSSTSMPGLTGEDAADLYRAMKLAYARVKDRIEVTDFYLSGYSLGAAQAAFIARLDEAERVFNFKRVLMINPPVSLYNSAEILDRLLEDNAPDGVAGFFRRMMRHIAEIYRDERPINFGDEDFFYKFYREAELRRDELAAAIGWAFRFSSASMTFTADVMTGSGYITPKGMPLPASASLTDYGVVAIRTSFLDYIRDMFVPYFQAREPGVDLQDLAFRASLRSIGPFLRESSKIGLVTNADDIILGEGELAWLEEVFGDRAKIYPTGGHCGNMDYTENVQYFIDFFTNSKLASRS